MRRLQGQGPTPPTRDISRVFLCLRCAGSIRLKQTMCQARWVVLPQTQQHQADPSLKAISQMDEGSKRYLELLKRCLTAELYDESAWSVVEAEHAKFGQPNDRVHSILALPRRLLIRALAKNSLLLVRRRAFDPECRQVGGDWPMFGYTMVGRRRLDNLHVLLEDVLARGVPGDLIEAGAWRGGCGILMKAILAAHSVTDRIVWLADSFEGMPKPSSMDDGWDLSSVQHLRASAQQVRDNFLRFGLLDDCVRLLEGWFRDTLPRAPIERIAILRLDGDLYGSTMDALTSLYDRVSPGGYVIVDDYGGWPSCRRAVTDFLQKRSLRVAIQQIDWTGVYWRVESCTPAS